MPESVTGGWTDGWTDRIPIPISRVSMCRRAIKIGDLPAIGEG